MQLLLSAMGSLWPDREHQIKADELSKVQIQKTRILQLANTRSSDLLVEDFCIVNNNIFLLAVWALSF